MIGRKSTKKLMKFTMIVTIIIFIAITTTRFFSIKKERFRKCKLLHIP